MKVTDFIISMAGYRGGLKEVYKFPNGYGASVVIGGELNSIRFEGAIEIAVLVFQEDGSFAITFNTVLTNDVEVVYSDIEVDNFLLQIASLGRDKPSPLLQLGLRKDIKKMQNS